ncbi:GDP-perosamine synthase [subsurface metagenome]
MKNKHQLYMWRPWFPRGIYSRLVKQYFATTNPRELLKSLEEELATYLGSKNVILMPSGTSAITTSLKVLLSQDKDEVLLPSLVCRNVPLAVQMAGKKPVFLEVRANTFNIDEDGIENQIGPRIGAIIAVYLFGLPCSITKVSETAKRRGILFIEDAAQALGASYREKKVGTLGDIGILSFNNKVTDACGGGAIVTDNDDFSYRIRRYRDSHFPITRKGFSRHLLRAWIASQHPRLIPAIGKLLPHKTKTNSAMCLHLSSLLLLRSLLSKTDFIVSRRRENSQWYNNYLKSPHIEKPSQDTIAHSACSFYSIQLKSDRLAKQKEAIIAELIRHGIYTQTIVQGHHHEFAPGVSLPITEELSRSILSLPTDPNIGEAEIRYASSLIDQVLDSFTRGYKDLENASTGRK